MPEIVDAFTHVLPRRFVKKINAIHPVDELADLDALAHLTAVEERIEDMDEFGVDKQVVTLAKPHAWRGLDPEDGLDLIRLANDEVSHMADDHPDRFIPVATLPFREGEYLDDRDRCLDDLGMAGVQIFSNVAGRPLDDFHPFFEEVSARDVPLWIHPQLHEWYSWADDYQDYKAIGWPFDTSLAMSRLVCSGIMEQLDLDVVTHHGGGMIPLYAERLARFNRPEHPNGANVSGPLLEYYRSFYADTVVNDSATQLRCTYDFFGADQVVFATDYPYGPDGGRHWLESTLELVDDLDVPQEVRTAIFGENIRSIVE